MCTVSFVHAGDKVIITSNRDEQAVRPSAMAPKNYRVNSRNIIFPKDKKAGGTWYAINENLTVLVLLNGAREKHAMGKNYRKSRGLVVLDLISSDDVVHEWQSIDLANIEPFTLVLYENKKLFQLQWDESEKDCQELDAGKNHIWSSSTLYPKEIREKRADWFRAFLKARPQVTEADMLHFHRYTEADDNRNGLVIDRDGILMTLSITQTVLEKNMAAVHYADLIAETEFSTSLISV